MNDLLRLLSETPKGRPSLFPVVAAVLVFGLASACFVRGYVNDFDCYWLGAWAVRDGVPEQMYASLDHPDEDGNFAVDRRAPEWVDLARNHLPRRLAPLAYIYPPHCAVATVALTPLPYSAALATWKLGNLAAYVVSVLLGLGVVRDRLTATSAQVLTTLALASPILVRTLTLGQISPVVLLSIVGFFALWRGGRPVAAGLALSVGIVLKLSPVVFLVWLAFRREGRPIAGALGGVAIGTALTLLGTGFGPFEHYFAHVLPLLARGTAFRFDLSVTALVARFLGVGTLNHFVLLPADARVRAASAVFGGVVTALSAVAVWRARPEVGFAVLNLAVLLVSPITWSNHLVNGLVPLMMLVPGLIAGRRWGLVGAAGVGYAAMLQAPDLATSVVSNGVGVALAVAGLVVAWIVACAAP